MLFDIFNVNIRKGGVASPSHLFGGATMSKLITHLLMGRRSLETEG